MAFNWENSVSFPIPALNVDFFKRLLCLCHYHRLGIVNGIIDCSLARFLLFCNLNKRVTIKFFVYRKKPESGP